MPAVNKIVFLGASSAAFGMSMFRDLFSSSDLCRWSIGSRGQERRAAWRSLRLAQWLGERAKLVRLIDDVLAGRAMMPSRWLQASGERAAMIISSVVHDRKQLIESAAVLNQGVIPNSPANAAVDVPVVADAAGDSPCFSRTIA